ncbi:MAG: alpha/beta fold hydrolase [Flaviflexus sp.]|nr:alpha/beta fold hydrolase [Flaviflexus sp.]
MTKSLSLAPWPSSDARNRSQQSIMRVDGAWVRIHRFAAMDPGKDRLNPDVRGDGRATFVLVHGIGLSSQYLVPLGEELAAHGEVMILDLPGFGDLPHPDDGMSMAGFAKVIRAAMEAHGLRDPILVGHSMGAQIVVEMMARWHDYDRGVLIGPPVNRHERTLPLVLARYLQSAIFERPNLALVALRGYARTLTSWVVSLMPALMGYRIEERIKQINPQARVMLLHGEHDHLAPGYWVEELASTITHSGTRQISGAAHSTVYNADDSVASDILALLRPDERGPAREHVDPAKQTP